MKKNNITTWKTKTKDPKFLITWIKDKNGDTYPVAISYKNELNLVMQDLTYYPNKSILKDKF